MSEDVPVAVRALAELREWRAELAGEKDDEAKLNALFGGIAALEHMRSTFPLLDSDLVTENEQVRLIGRHVKATMQRHNETRRLPSEMGRTTRSTGRRARDLTHRLNAVQTLAALNTGERDLLLDQLQAELVREVQRYLDRKAIRVQINLALPGPLIVADILSAAGKLTYGGPVAQHLVGAKLAVRFPELPIENHPYTAADVQTGRAGDFSVGNAVFHVTMRETEAVVRKCGDNVVTGLRPYLLVPEARMLVTRQLVADQGLESKVVASSIEAFVGQNVDEMSNFSASGLRAMFLLLLNEYNRRVEEVESNRGLLIEVPAILQSVEP